MTTRTGGSRGLARLGAVAAVTALTVAGALTATTLAASAAPAGAARAATVTAKAAASQAAVGATYKPPTRNLQEGDSGADVKALQQRLKDLAYYPGAVDGNFGPNTLEAVWAFQEVNGVRPVTGVVASKTKYYLVHPRTYQAHHAKAPDHIEVNISVRVLVFWHNHKIALISHVSTAGHYYYPCGSGTCYADTPTGTFWLRYFIKGWHHAALGYMYNPAYFNFSGYAIHGDSSVPLNPVSHGCVRIPMDIASWFYKDLVIPGVNTTSSKGTPVFIYNK